MVRSMSATGGSPRQEKTAAARRDELLSQLFVTPAELAELLPLNRRTIISLIGKGEIPAQKYGLKWLIPVEWVRGQAQAERKTA